MTRLITVDGKPVPYHMFHAWIALAHGVPPACGGDPRAARARASCRAGIQIIGPEGGDLDVLAIAEALESQMGGFQRPPEDSARRRLWS